jgi:GDP-mannose 6-dehydrogenase
MPGFAYGGSCLPKDTRGINHLANTLDVKIPVIKNIMKSNETHIEHAKEMIEMMPGKKVGFLGITFKAGTDDLRESPAIELVKQLSESDYDIKIFDPNFTPTPLHDTDHTQTKMNDVGTMLSSMATEDSDSLLTDCDMLVVTHNDESFKSIVEQAKGKLPVIDLVRMDEQHTKSEQINGICW